MIIILCITLLILVFLVKTGEKWFPMSTGATPTSCSNKGHDVSFRTGAVDECRTCKVKF